MCVLSDCVVRIETGSSISHDYWPRKGVNSLKMPINGLRLPCLQVLLVQRSFSGCKSDHTTGSRNIKREVVFKVQKMARYAQFCLIMGPFKEEVNVWILRAYRKLPTLFRFWRSPPYFYFRFRLYGHWDGRFCLIFARTAQQSVVKGTNGLSSFKPCAFCWIVHRADIFAIAQLSCTYLLISNGWMWK